MTALSPRKRPRQARAQATVDAILEATAQVLVRDGIERLSTNRIAKRAGVSVGSLYQYFPNKDALLLALLERHDETMMAMLEDCISSLFDAPLEEAVRTYIKAMIEAHRLDPELHFVLTTQIPRLMGVDGLMDLQQRAEEVVRAFLTMRAGDVAVKNVEAAAFMLVSTVEGVVHLSLLKADEIDFDALAHELSTMLIRYLKPGSQDPDAQ